MFEMRISKIMKTLNDFEEFAASHGWSYSKTKEFISAVDTFEMQTFETIEHSNRNSKLLCVTWKELLKDTVEVTP